MTELEKMKAGQLYDYSDPEIFAAHVRAVELCDEYNETKRTEMSRREEILRELFGRLGKNPVVEKNIRVDYGFNLRAGDNFFANYDCVFLDCAPITFGDNIFIAPQCGFYSVNHPLDAATRNKGVEKGLPITVGSDVWFGGGVKVMPGVTIGDNVVIGGGSVVVKDIPSDSLAVGNPARVVKNVPPRKKKKILLWAGGGKGKGPPPRHLL